MIPRNLIGNPYKNIRWAIQKCISTKERVVKAERATFLSVIKSERESHDDLLVRLREEARYCDFEKHKISANFKEELLKINLFQD